MPRAKPGEKSEEIIERLGDRLRAKLNQKELAARLGITEAAVSSWFTRGGLANWGRLREVCEAAALSADWLLGLPQRAPTVAVPAEKGDWVVVPRVSEQVAAGDEVYDESAIQDRDWYAFRAPFVRHLVGKNIEPGRLVIVTVARGWKGESMLPTIKPGAVVMIDRGPGAAGWSDVEDGKIYLCRPAEEGVTLKRVFKRDRYLLLLSDNPVQGPLPPLDTRGRQYQDVLLGRVRWIGQEEG